jgi:hypothetical protein
LLYTFSIGHVFLVNIFLLIQYQDLYWEVVLVPPMITDVIQDLLECHQAHHLYVLNRNALLDVLLIVHDFLLCYAEG